jgi:hypothetical protein
MLIARDLHFDDAAAIARRRRLASVSLRAGLDSHGLLRDRSVGDSHCSDWFARRLDR